MILTAERQWMVAIAYEKAAADTIGVPAPQRAAFARKAKRFRTLARIAAKIEATTVVKQAPPLMSRQMRASNLQCAPKAKGPTLSERLEKARAAKWLPSGEERPAGPHCRSS